MIKNLVPSSTNLGNQVSSDQKKIFDGVQKHLCLDQNQMNHCQCLLVNVEGCFLIHVIKSMVSNQFNNGSRNTVAVSSGLAALNIDRVTLRRLLMLSGEHAKTAQYHTLGVDNLAAMQNTLANLRHLIVDEISVVSHLFLAYINLRLVEIRGKDKLLGVISILFFVDLLQPVKENNPYSKLTHT